MSLLPTALLAGLGAALALPWLHDVVVALFGVPRPRPSREPSRRRRFAILVAAHDEEAVIEPAVRSFLGQAYPRELFEVHVVADRCSDRTAEAARAAGAVVHERCASAGGGGKPAALRWLVERLAGRGFEAACVFDADNLASSSFLESVNRRLDEGERCVQGYLDTKNPDDTWVSGSIALAYWTTNRLFQAARERLGLSCALGGTGFCLDWDLAERVAWRTDCLTEDLDLQVRLVLAGGRVAWAHDARTYDEKPLALRASLRQRVRWMRGHWDVARRAFVPLLAAAAARRSWTALDAALYVLQPLRIVLGATLLLGVALAAALGGEAPDPWILAAAVVPYFSYLAHACFAGMPGLGLLLERVPLPSWRFYPAAFLFGLTWIPAAAWGVLTSRRTAWSHTRHVRAVTLGEREADADSTARGRAGVAEVAASASITMATAAPVLVSTSERLTS